MTKKSKEVLAENARENLKLRLKDGAKLFFVIRSVSASGMSRRMDAYVFVDAETPLWLSRSVADLFGWNYKDGKGFLVKGTGMDMVWHVKHLLEGELGIQLEYGVL